MNPIITFETIGVIISLVLSAVGIWLIYDLNRDVQDFKNS